MFLIKNITKAFDEKIVFKNIDISIPRGAIVSLTGKNGIGKTTLLNILAGLTRVEGNIEYNGVKINENYTSYMEKVVLLDNNTFLYDFLTLEEMYQLIKSISTVPVTEGIYEELVEALELEEYRDMFIGNLSLGTRQKVLLICSLITLPEIILFDEPFVNLDQASVNALLSFLTKYIKERNGIIIFSTHSEDNRLKEFMTHTLKIINSETVVFSEREKNE